MTNIEEIYESCLNLSISKLDNLISDLRSLRNEKFASTYKVVKIFPGNRIERKIESETGFYCYHKPCEGYSSGRGTHCIVIPIEKYTEELEKELIKKYDIN